MQVFISLGSNGVIHTVSLLHSGAPGEMSWPLNATEFQNRACAFLSRYQPEYRKRYSPLHLSRAMHLISLAEMGGHDLDPLAEAVLHLLAYNPETLTRIQELLNGNGDPNQT